MKINTKLSIATHIVLCIAFFENEGTTSNLLAKSVKTNPSIIRRILLKLQAAGIVETDKKGSRLIKDEEDITLLSIYEHGNSREIEKQFKSVSCDTIDDVLTFLSKNAIIKPMQLHRFVLKENFNGEDRDYYIALFKSDKEQTA